MLKNNSYDNSYIKLNIKNNNNKKKKIFEKFINQNKLKILNKFIKKEKQKSNTNIKTEKIKCIKELDNTIYNSSNKNMNYIFNINNTYVNYINTMPKEAIKQKSFEKNIINNIYTNDKSNLESKTKYSRNDWYCFPDNKLRKIKGLSKGSKKLLKYVNIKNKKQMNKRYLDASKINNYFTYISNYNKTIIEDNQNLSTERSGFNNKNKSIDEKNNHEYFMKKSFVHQLVVFPIKIEKFIRRIIIINNGYLFFENLNKINIKKIIIIKRNKLLSILKNINKKILKYYFRIYRDNVLIEKVKLIYQKKITITKLRSKNKKSHNIQSKAKLFITKASNNNHNYNKNNCLKNYEIFLEKIKSLIYKYHIFNDFIILNNLKPNNFFFENKINRNNTIDAEIKLRKKHIKVKYIRKISCKSIGKNNFRLSDKTTSSNLSKSTISHKKKIKVYRRIVSINDNEITEKIRKQFELKMTYIISKICTKEKQKFSKWKKLIFN